MRVLWLRLVQLWRTEPAVLRSGLAGAIGLVSLLLGLTADADALASQVLNILGVIVILGSGFAVRPKVTPWNPEE